MYLALNDIISVIFPGKPDPPSNVQFQNIHTNGFTVVWQAGFDGGYPPLLYELQYKDDMETEYSQQFSVQMTSSEHYKFVSFHVTGLVPSATYAIRIRAQNKKSMCSQWIYEKIMTGINFINHH